MKYHSLSAPLEPASSLREQFLIQGLFREGSIESRYWEIDRTVIGGAVPLAKPLTLAAPALLGSATFCERREVGIINLGGPGRIEVGGQSVAMGMRDGYYAGRGSPDLVFHSDSPEKPARFYFLSYLAHRSCESRKVSFADVSGLGLGTPQAADLRTLYKYFAPGLVETCQLTMGLTEMKEGSVWNTMPPHTHLRRSEVYCYFNVPSDNAVFHFMGDPAATRHLVVRDLEAVLSPSWSIHSGVGTAAYSFVWGMGGENQVFSDMQPAPIKTLL